MAMRLGAGKCRQPLRLAVADLPLYGNGMHVGKRVPVTTRMDFGPYGYDFHFALPLCWQHLTPGWLERVEG